MLELAFNEPKLRELNNLWLSMEQQEEPAQALAWVARKRVKNEGLRIKTQLKASSDELKALEKRVNELLWEGNSEYFLLFNDVTGRISLGTKNINGVSWKENLSGWRAYEDAVFKSFGDPKNKSVSWGSIFENVAIFEGGSSIRMVYEQFANIRCFTIPLAARSGSRVETLDLTTEVMNANTGVMPKAPMIAFFIVKALRDNDPFHGFTLKVPDADEVWKTIKENKTWYPKYKDRIEYKDGVFMLKGNENEITTTTSGGTIGTVKEGKANAGVIGDITAEKRVPTNRERTLEAALKKAEAAHKSSENERFEFLGKRLTMPTIFGYGYSHNNNLKNAQKAVEKISFIEAFLGCFANDIETVETLLERMDIGLGAGEKEKNKEKNAKFLQDIFGKITQLTKKQAEDKLSELQRFFR